MAVGADSAVAPYYISREDANALRYNAMGSEDANGFSWFGTEEACVKAMAHKSFLLREANTAHCPADFDQLSVICWPPTPANHIAEHPCTPDGFLNPNMFARRRCLPDATWFVNTSFDRHPYTDFTDCLTPWVVSEEEKLRKLAGDKIVRMLNSLDSHRRLYVSLYVVAIFLLAASIVACVIVLVRVKVSQHRLRSIKRQSSRTSSTSSAVFQSSLPWPHMPHTLLAVAALVLLADNIVSIILSSSGWPDYLINCRAYKSIDILSMLVFYQCLLGYVILGVSRILRYRFKVLYVRIIVVTCSVLTSLIVGLELLAEVIIFPTHYCGFGNMQGTFHWIYTGPKYLIIMCTICLAICNGFGAFCLHQPSLGSVREKRRHVSDSEDQRDTERDESCLRVGRENITIKKYRDLWFHRVKVKRAEDVMTLRHIRQGSISVIITIVFSLLREVMVVLLHFITAKNKFISDSVTHMVAPHEQISNYARMYALVTCLHGIIFALAMCFGDVRVIATLTQCFKSVNCGWQGKNVQNSCPPSPSLSNSSPDCCVCFKRQRRKNFTYYNRRNGSGIEETGRNSPGRDVITPILEFSTPSPQNPRCVTVRASVKKKSSGKTQEESPIPLADNPTRDPSQRPVIRPSIESSPRPLSDGPVNGAHQEFPERYKSRYTYRQVSH
ncbi:hypothetical protein EGW08_012004 [Elysia chlorotica]|uniref:G-protein coupled receptors family 2 profile 1 domain-containing protein n=1 Tax=Elysia chlorotica TaxID=188477 RepID=A0A3S0ZJ92_ELYCH|nr:hypothetical protein EGW08_012004 [Elysia chlorotica]